MNYKEVKDYALQLINQYSIAGSEIASTYNDQADYLAQIPNLVNDAQMYIATTAKHIPTYVNLCDLDCEPFGGGFLKYTLPMDAWQLSSRGLYQTTCGHMRRYSEYQVIADKEFLVPVGMTNRDCMVVEYYRYPRPLKKNSSGAVVETQVLDNEPETHSLVAYYVAAHLIMYDDSFRYSALQNEFETKLSRLEERRVATYEPVRDAYSGDPYSGWSDGYGS